jgi:hypothetical protein
MPKQNRLAQNCGGAMTVTERRETALARKDTPQAEQHSL